jgi:hypothetical protein
MEQSQISSFQDVESRNIMQAALYLTLTGESYLLFNTINWQEYFLETDAKQRIN